MLNKPVAAIASRSGTHHYLSLKNKLLVAAVSACFAAGHAWANPGAPVVVNGSAGFYSNGAVLNVTNSNGTIINWNSFSIGAGETTRFIQPSAASAVLNRVIMNDPSSILGNLTSNGNVWLVNPAGIMVGTGARIDVAGFIASTLNIRNEDFLAGRLNFQNTPGAGIVGNRGQISTPSGGSVYLVGPSVENSGLITAPNGEIILAAGEKVSLYDTGTPGIKVEIVGAEGNATNVGTLAAEAGRIGMAGLLVKNSGTINASSVVRQGGRVFLRARRDVALDASSQLKADGGQAGSGGNITVLAEGAAYVDGSLSAKGGSHAGNGGFIETSGARVRIADGTRVNTLASNGRAGTWLIDPVDFTIAAGSATQTISGIGADTLSTALGGGSVAIATDPSTAGNGDIFVNGAVTWSAGTTLTLSAAHDIAVNAGITATGNAAGLRLYYGGTDGAASPAGGTGYSLNYGAAITLSGASPTLWIGNNQYTVINSLGAAGDATGGSSQTLQGMARAGNLGGNFALGSNIDATATANWNSNGGGGFYGFTPLGDDTTKYSGKFDGLGHSIAGLTINRPATDYVGLFGYSSGAAIRNIGLSGGNVSGKNSVGALVGSNDGAIVNVYASASVSGIGNVGGLVGSNLGTIDRAFATGNVSGTGNFVGGLAGYSAYEAGEVISKAYATGNVTGVDSVGGLIGYNRYGNINDSYATGSVNGSDQVGGLVGYYASTTVSNSYATGSVTGTGSVGGLVGVSTGTVSNSFYTSTQPAGAGGTPKTTTELKQLATFSGWSIADTGGSSAVWRIYKGHTAPLLRSFLTPLTVTADNVTKTYNGSIVTSLSNASYSVAGADSSAHILNIANPYNGAVAAGSYAPGLYSSQLGYDISHVNGTLTINPALITVTGNLTGSTSKVYDGTNTATLTSGNYSLLGFVSTEGANITKTSGTFDTVNVGSSKTVTVTLTTGDYAATGSTNLSNYSLPASLSGAIGTITQAPLTVTGVSANDKTYDGKTGATLNTASSAITGVFGGDTVTLNGGTGSFVDRNIGAAKPVTFTGLNVGGPDAGNYYLAAPLTGLSAAIKQLASVAWTGAVSNDWSNAANWAGGALPDGKNVLAVTIPVGKTVVYDAAVAANTTLNTLNSAGSLELSGGVSSNLTINNLLSTLQFTMNSGALTGAGNLFVTENFSQTGGTIALTGASEANLQQINGNLVVGNVSASSVTLKSNGGIAQNGAITTASLTTDSATGTTLTGFGNQINQFDALNRVSGDIALLNNGVLAVTAKNLNGSIAIENNGATSTFGIIEAAGGVSFVTHSPLTIGSGGVTAGGNISLSAGATPGSGDDLTLGGAIKTTGLGATVALSAGDNLLQNANIVANGGNVSAQAITGNISMALLTSTATSGGSIGYAAPGGNLTITELNAGNGASAVTAGGNLGVTPGFKGPNLIGRSAIIAVGGDAVVTTKARLLDVTVGGNFTITDAITGTVFSDAPSTTPTQNAAVQKTVDQVTSAIASSTAIASTSGSPSSQTSSFSDTQTSLKDSQQGAQSTAGSSSSSSLKLIAVGYSRGGNEGEFGSEEGASTSKANGKGNEDSKGKGKQSTGETSKTSKTSKPAANCN